MGEKVVGNGEKELPLEIEKKFLIRMPDLKWIESNTNVKIAKISQTYLGLKKNGFGDRVRKMMIDGKIKYYHTSKKSLSNMTRIEVEREISQKEYYEYMSRKSKGGTLRKTRYIVSMNGIKYEIDIYPFWEETAILEIELKSEKDKYVIPDFIEVIGDVTGNRDYSNSSISKKFNNSVLNRRGKYSSTHFEGNKKVNSKYEYREKNRKFESKCSEGNNSKNDRSYRRNSHKDYYSDKRGGYKYGK